MLTPAAPVPDPLSGTGDGQGDTDEATAAGLASNTAQLAADAARAELARLRSAYDEALRDGGVVLVQQADPWRDVFHVSASVTGLLGWAPATFLTEGVLRAMVHPDDLATFDAALPPLATTAAPTVIDLTAGASGPADVGQRAAPAPGEGEPVVRLRTSAGAWARVELRPMPPALDARAAPLARAALVGAGAHEHRRVRDRRFAELVAKDPAGCLVLEFVDPSDPGSLVIRAANPAAHSMFRLEGPVVDGTPLEAVLGAASAQLVRSALFDVQHTGESMSAERLSLSEVRGAYLDLRVDRLRDGTLAMVLEDVTETVALEERLRHQASHDALTGLPNRALFEERLGLTVAGAVRESPVALIMVDLDGFRAVNESHGLHAGDQLLVEVGHRLVREVRGCAIVSRIGGDEFALVTMPCSNDAEAIERANAVAAALARPFEVDGHLVSLGASIGVVLAPAHAQDARTALRLANQALDRAKADSSHLVVHDAGAAPGSIHRLALLSELRQGLANRDLELRYQPVVDLRTGRVGRVDAVLRWRRDDDATHMPVEFLEMAEQSGLIQPLTRWILSEAAAAAGSLARSDRPMVVSANLSARNLFDPDLLTFLGLVIASGELEPSRIELEVSETELMDDPVRTAEVLGQLSALGLGIVVDEFGTGYTSLSTMQHLPVTGLKIDRSFVGRILESPADAAIVRSTVELCHDLGLRVGAEGVRDERTLAMLASFGCDLAQGPHLSEPVDATQLPERIEQLESAARAWLGTTA